MPDGQGEPAVQGAIAEQAVGVGFHLRRHLEGVRLCRPSPWSLEPVAFPWLDHRRLCPAHRWLAGKHLPPCGARRSMNAARSKASALSTIANAAANTCLSNTPNGWQSQASNLRWAASAKAMTTRWPRRSTVSSKPRSSTVAARGAASKRSNTQPSNGLTAMHASPAG